MQDKVHRRAFLTLSSAAVASAALSSQVHAIVPNPYSWDASPPMDDGAAFVEWMQENRGEDPRYLRPRFDRFLNMVDHGELYEPRNKRAFLLTPREEFCRPDTRSVIYDIDYHDIGFGVTITGPRIVGRMTSAIDVQMGEKVLEIGTGSGYQSAYLANLTEKVWSIEIIKPLAERTRGLYDRSSSAATPNTDPSIQSMATDTMAGKRSPPSTRSSSLAASTIFLRHCCSSFARWHHGRSNRASRRAAASEGRKGSGRRRPGHSQALGHLQRQAGPLHPAHQAGRR